MAVIGRSRGGGRGGEQLGRLKLRSLRENGRGEGESGNDSRRGEDRRIN